MERARRPVETDDVVVPLFGAAEPDQPPLTKDELLALRRMMREFAIIRATCPMAVRALSTRPLPD